MHGLLGALLLSFGLGSAPPPPAASAVASPLVESSKPSVFAGASSVARPDLPSSYFGARYYGSHQGRFTTVDPRLNIKLSLFDAQRFNRYSYGLNNPLQMYDPDGREPVKNQAGTAAGFVAVMNASRTAIGTRSGPAGQAALARLGDWEFSAKHVVVPSTTPPFNNSGNRYVYTKKGGWIDMAHFLFYAGRAEQAAMAGSSTPLTDAVREGYHQERLDGVGAPQSAYSYEDLPSDKLGAEFATSFYDPTSKQSLGAQVQDYLDSLGATNPEEAPNWKGLPDTPSKNPPTVTNRTTDPMFTK